MKCLFKDVLMKTALLVIDVQNDMFRPEDRLYEPGPLLSVIGKVLQKARIEAVPVIYVQHNSIKGGRFINGSEGWKVHREIAPEPGEIAIQKTTPDSFYRTELSHTLELLGIQRLVVTGIQSELCVDTTTRRATSLEYEVTLLSDGHSTFDRKAMKAPDIIRFENEVLKGWFADVESSDSLEF